MSDCHTLQSLVLDLLIQEATLRFCGVKSGHESLNVGDRVSVGTPAIERHQHLTVVDRDRLKSGRIESVDHGFEMLRFWSLLGAAVPMS